MPLRVGGCPVAGGDRRQFPRRICSSVARATVEAFVQSRDSPAVGAIQWVGVLAREVRQDAERGERRCECFIGKLRAPSGEDFFFVHRGDSCDPSGRGGTSYSGHSGIGHSVAIGMERADPRPQRYVAKRVTPIDEMALRSSSKRLAGSERVPALG